MEAVLCIGILLSTVIYDVNSDVWWLDDVVALCIAVCLVSYGGISVFKHRKLL